MVYRDEEALQSSRNPLQKVEKPKSQELFSETAMNIGWGGKTGTQNPIKAMLNLIERLIRWPEQRPVRFMHCAHASAPCTKHVAREPQRQKQRTGIAAMERPGF
jgi:hypothetical protein